MKQAFYFHKKTILIFTLLLFHSIGFIGISFKDTHNYFLSLSFFNLLLSFCILILAREKQSFKFYLFVFFCSIYGMTVEWIGVHTHYLFGNYNYGTNLGAKIGGVPLIIGINWCVLTVSTNAVAHYITTKWWLHILISCGLMVGIDFLIEPFAVKSNYWSWQNNTIPLYNYFCWFFVSIPIHYLYFRMGLNEQNIVSRCLFFVLMLFFFLLIF